MALHGGRLQDFGDASLDCDAGADQVIMAQKILAVLTVWQARSPDADQALVARVLRRSLDNLTAKSQTGEHSTGRIHLSQVICYSVDQGFSIQLRKGKSLVPHFPNRQAWQDMIQAALTATSHLLQMVGYPVTIEEELPPDTYSSLNKMTRAEANKRLLDHTFARLEFDGYKNLLGETLFFQSPLIMSGPWMSSTGGWTAEVSGLCLRQLFDDAFLDRPGGISS
jgi:hypothetical protein